MAEETQAVEQTTDTAVEQRDDSSLPVGGQQDGEQQESTEAAPHADTQSQQEKPQAKQAQATDGSTPAWWKPDLFSLKYRGSTVRPRDYNHAVNLMQKGYSYESAMEQVKKEREQLDGHKGLLEQYGKLDEAFKKNPAFKQRILQLYEEAQGGVNQQAQQYAQNPQQNQAPLQNDPRYQQLLQELGTVKEAVKQWQTEKADMAVENEMGSLKSQFPDVKFDQVTESGHTLMWDVLNHAHQNRFPNLLSAARDYLFDSMVGNAKMAGAQAVAQQRQEQARRGVVSTGPQRPAAQAAPQDLSGLGYDRLTQIAKQSLGLKT